MHWLRAVIAMLESAPRLGAAVDDPEGSRVVAISDTAAKIMAAELRKLADQLESADNPSPAS